MSQHNTQYNDDFQLPDDRYAEYAEEFDPINYDRKARRKRNRVPNHTPKKARHEIIDELADDTGLAGGFDTTYQPGEQEEAWLLHSIQAFYYQDFINDVIAQVKGGKEASVYRCQATNHTAGQWLAAKVYRPRQFRELSNDAMYREGRPLIGADGKELTERNAREMRAVNKGSSFGQVLAHTSWLMYEYRTLKTLHAAGASVPEPVAASENAILMAYIGDEQLPAPTLNEVQLQDDEAPHLFQQALRNVEILLREGLVHGDLSAYNILYWQGDIVLIDFPQVVTVQGNRNARAILARDIKRLCDYFSVYGLSCNADAITAELWSVYGVEDENPDEMLFNRLSESSMQAGG
jgi:RIO kinase 1